MIAFATRIGDQNDEIKLDFSSFTAVFCVIMAGFRSILTMVVIMVIMMMMVVMVLMVMVTTVVFDDFHHRFMSVLMAAAEADHDAFSQPSKYALERNSGQQETGCHLRKHLEFSISRFKHHVQC